MINDSFVDSLVLNTETVIGEMEGLQEKLDTYDFCKLKNCPEILSEDIENVLGKLVVKNPEKLLINEAVAVKSKRYGWKTEVKRKISFKELL